MSESHTCKRVSYLLPNGSRVTVESTHPRGRIRVTTEKPNEDTEPLVVYAITFDQDTFGIFRTREAAEADLEQQIADGGPAWRDCEVKEWMVW